MNKKILFGYFGTVIFLLMTFLIVISCIPKKYPYTNFVNVFYDNTFLTEEDCINIRAKSSFNCLYFNCLNDSIENQTELAYNYNLILIHHSSLNYLVELNKIIDLNKSLSHKIAGFYIEETNCEDMKQLHELCKKNKLRFIVKSDSICEYSDETLLTNNLDVSENATYLISDYEDIHAAYSLYHLNYDNHVGITYSSYVKYFDSVGEQS